MLHATLVCFSRMVIADRTEEDELREVRANGIHEHARVRDCEHTVSDFVVVREEPVQVLHEHCHGFGVAFERGRDRFGVVPPLFSVVGGKERSARMCRLRVGDDDLRVRDEIDHTRMPCQQIVQVIECVLNRKGPFVSLMDGSFEMESFLGTNRAIFEHLSTPP